MRKNQGVMKIITTMVEDDLFEGSNQYGNKVSIDMRKMPHKNYEL